MARIRSIHPGIFTDEAFASASMAARMLLIGIWTEAYDDGVFEWKPLTLKMKIFPGDSVDINAVLSELGGSGSSEGTNSTAVNTPQFGTSSAISARKSRTVPAHFRTRCSYTLAVP